MRLKIISYYRPQSSSDSLSNQKNNMKTGKNNLREKFLNTIFYE